MTKPAAKDSTRLERMANFFYTYLKLHHSDILKEYKSSFNFKQKIAADYFIKYVIRTCISERETRQYLIHLLDLYEQLCKDIYKKLNATRKNDSFYAQNVMVTNIDKATKKISLSMGTITNSQGHVVASNQSCIIDLNYFTFTHDTKVNQALLNAPFYRQRATSLDLIARVICYGGLAISAVVALIAIAVPMIATLLAIIAVGIAGVSIVSGLFLEHIVVRHYTHKAEAVPEASAYSSALAFTTPQKPVTTYSYNQAGKFTPPPPALPKSESSSASMASIRQLK